MKGEVERLQGRIDEHVAQWDKRAAEYEAEIERLRTAIETHKERWTSVNSGDLKQNAYPKDLELWAVLESSTDVAV